MTFEEMKTAIENGRTVKSESGCHFKPYHLGILRGEWHARNDGHLKEWHLIEICTNCTSAWDEFPPFHPGDMYVSEAQEGYSTLEIKKWLKGWGDKLKELR